MKYKTYDLSINDVPKVGIILDKYPDTTFTLSYIKFDESGDNLKLKFHYDVVEGITPSNHETFKNDIGDFIVYYLKNPSVYPIVYSGGSE